MKMGVGLGRRGFWLLLLVRFGLDCLKSRQYKVLYMYSYYVHGYPGYFYEDEGS